MSRWQGNCDSGGFVSREMLLVTGGLAMWISTGAAAVTVIPEKPGFGGYVNMGGGAVEIESNLLAKAANGIVDVGDPVIDDIESAPDGESAFIPTFNFELSYTFESSRTQLYVGNLLEDFLTFDLSALAGIRQEVSNVGVVGLALVSTSLSTDVWEDPYQSGVKRQDTERTAEGYRVNWGRVFDSGLELEYSSKSIDIDRERSGEGLGLSDAQRRLLNRNGDLNRLQLSYEFQLEGGRHIVTPGLVYRDSDRDGDAMANDGYGATLNYIYRHDERWRWVFNASWQTLDYSEVNPVYDARDDADNYGFSATVFYSAPFGWKPWALNVTAGYFEQDHDIDFYDTSVAAVTVAMFRSF